MLPSFFQAAWSYTLAFEVLFGSWIALSIVPHGACALTKGSILKALTYPPSFASSRAWTSNEIPGTRPLGASQMWCQDFYER